MAQDKAVTNSTAGAIQDNTQKQNNKGIKVSKAKIKSLKGRLNSSQIEKRGKGRPPVTIDYTKLESFASQNIENYKIAEALDISVATFYKLMKDDEMFRNAYNQGMENRKYELEKALYKRAEGYQATEVKIVETKDPEKGTTVQKTVTEKNYVPDATALIFTLSNIYSDKYKQRGAESKLDINVNINDMRQLSDSELAKLASGTIAEAVEYSIE